MTPASVKKLLVVSALLALSLVSCGGGGGSSPGPAPVAATAKVGVMLPLSGPDDLGWRKSLDWAREEINLALPEGTPKIELVYADTASEGLSASATRLLQDQSVKAVIGPDTSSAAEEVAPRFVHAKKLLVSPSATAEQLFRAFAGKKYFMRTVESDVAQLETMLVVAKIGGASSASMITSFDDYGSTFFNWFGFLTAEGGIEARAVVRYEPSLTDCGAHVDSALAGSPDVLFAIALNTDMAACIKTRAELVSPATRVIFSDGSYNPTLITKLGALAEELEGVAPSEDPATGFSGEYKVRHGSEPPPFAANAFDALYLIACGLVGSGGAGGEALVTQVFAATDARNTPPGWGREAMRATFAAIKAGQNPETRGASGTLDYDLQFHVDPTTSYYTHWVVESGAFVEKEFFITGAERVQDTGAANRKASNSLRQNFAVTPGPALPRSGLWALIVAGSDGWENYRHQADALAQYQLLKKNGLGDDRIILIIADDLAANERNLTPGVVQNVEGGENLYVGVEVDYRLNTVSAGKILEILEGRSSPGFDRVVAAGAGDNIYVYMTGHGNQEGFFVDSASALTWGQGSLLTSTMLNDSLTRLKTADGYRQALIVVEACNSGTMGSSLIAPDALLMAAANPFENSLAANHRGSDGLWLADQFSYEFLRGAVEAPAMTLQDAYLWSYQRVSGSHVTLYNYANFQGVASVPLADFIDL